MNVCCRDGVHQKTEMWLREGGRNYIPVVKRFQVVQSSRRKTLLYTKFIYFKIFPIYLQNLKDFSQI